MDGTIGAAGIRKCLPSLGSVRMFVFVGMQFWITFYFHFEKYFFMRKLSENFKGLCTNIVFFFVKRMFMYYIVNNIDDR